MNQKLNMQDLAGLLSEKTGLSKKESESFLKELFGTVEEYLVKDKIVKVKGLGTFKITEVGERESIDVNTKERLVLRAHNRISFVAETKLEDTVNEPFALFEPVEIGDNVQGKLEEEEEDPEEEEDEEEIKENIEKYPVEEKEKSEPIKVFREEERPAQVSSQDNEEAKTEYPSEEKSEKRKNKKILIAISIALPWTLVVAAAIFYFIKFDPMGIVRSRRNIEVLSNVVIPDSSLKEKSIRTTTKEKAKAAEIKKDSVKPNPTVTKPKVKTVILKEGERLTILSQREYGNKCFWVYIYKENMSRIKDPGNVAAGTMLVLPPASKYGIDKNDPRSVRTAEKLAPKYLAK